MQSGKCMMNSNFTVLLLCFLGSTSADDSCQLIGSTSTPTDASSPPSESLMLSHCTDTLKIDDVPKDTIKHLILSNNYLPETSLMYFKDYPEIIHFKFLDNTFKNGPCIWSNLPKLTTLVLKSPQLVLDPVSFSSLPSLQLVYMEVHKLTEATLEHFPDNLEELLLQNVLIGHMGVIQIKKDYPNLCILRIRNCHLNAVTFMGDISSLHSLDLSGNNLEDIHFFITPNVSVANLNLSSNVIHQLHIRSFIQMPALRELNLAHNHIDSIPPNLFERNQELRRVDLSGNHIKRLYLHPTGSSNKFALSLQRNDLECQYLENIKSSNHFTQSYVLENVYDLECHGFQPVGEGTNKFFLFTALLFLAYIILSCTLKVIRLLRKILSGYGAEVVDGREHAVAVEDVIKYNDEFVELVLTPGGSFDREAAGDEGRKGSSS